ncbi:hypothetical protein [Pseudonocardia sp. MH-G8]|uniref:hypothetical protein n=1 Tax=Pseudonocardia sp. MH-G8 TaxID=1854588 RepID=UPI00117B8FD6|nr:hypothetical protein [Pseudonocardia sp. MH-G8]
MTTAQWAQSVRPGQQPPGGGDGGSGLGTYLSDPIGSMTASAFDAAMQKVWDAGIGLLRGGLSLADDVAVVDPSAIIGGDAASLRPTMVWLATVIGLGLFFYQLISVAVRGGRGMFRAFAGPVQFGIAIALTTGTVATLLTAADGLTTMFLSSLSAQGDFASIVDNPVVADRIGPDPELSDVDGEVRSMLLGLAAFFGTIPAGIGFSLLMIFRQAAVLVLIATIPIAAAGLVADTTASIFWRSARWILAAILMKPALGLVLLVGVTVMARADGVAGLLAGTAVLLVALACPIGLFRLLAFVDPGTAAGAAVRSRGEWRGFSEPGSDNGTTESVNIARYTEQAHRPGGAQHGGSTAAAGGELGGTTAVADGTAHPRRERTAGTGDHADDHDADDHAGRTQPQETR